MPVPDRPALLYDDGCRFCRATVDAVRIWDGRRCLALLPWSDPLAREWMAALASDARERSMHVMQPDGVLLSGGDAFVAVIAVLPGLGWLARLAGRVDWVRRLLGGAYRLVAANRGPLSRIVPNRPAAVQRPAVR